MKRNIIRTAIIYLFLTLCFNAVIFPQHTGVTVMKSEDIFSSAPFSECHASTIAETPEGLVAAFFGGTEEKNPDVSIWLCRNDGKVWSSPTEVANGIQTDGKRYPCWNPVLYNVSGGPLMLFYKVGPNPVEWWGMLMTSADNGKTWNLPQRLPDGIFGPVKNKPEMVDNGILLCPSSVEGNFWQVQMEMTADTGRTWSKVIVSTERGKYNAIQPAILRHRKGKLQILCRSRENCIVQSWSKDNGLTWSPLSATKLPNNNSGIDAVTLVNGEHILIYNPTTIPEGRWTGDRTPLYAGMSRNGRHWHRIAILESEPGEFSYPAVIQTRDGLVHIIYTWKRKTIKHVVLSMKN